MSRIGSRLSSSRRPPKPPILQSSPAWQRRAARRAMASCFAVTAILLLGFVGLAAPAQAQTIGLNETVTGTLSTGDRQFTDDSFFDEFAFEGTSGQEITIDLTSADFDAFLQVHPPTGDAIASNDKATGDTNSQLVMTLEESGTYRIFANSFRGNETGS